MSLNAPHRMFTSAGSKTYEVVKARIQLLFLSSQYPCAKLTRHWTPENQEKLCSFPICTSKHIVESPEHLLLHCPAYAMTRNSMISLCLGRKDPVSHALLTSFLKETDLKMMQFLLDCSVLPEVIANSQQYGVYVLNDIFYCSRNWCYGIHRERMKRLGRWNFR